MTAPPDPATLRRLARMIADRVPHTGERREIAIALEAAAETAERFEALRKSRGCECSSYAYRHDACPACVTVAERDAARAEVDQLQARVAELTPYMDDVSVESHFPDLASIIKRIVSGGP